MMPQAVQPAQGAPQAQQAPALDSVSEILERNKTSTDNRHQEKIYDLRMISANVLDITTSGSQNRPQRQDGRFADMDVTEWEESRHNPVTSNTAIQAKSLSFNKPDFEWRYVRPGVAMTRKAWYLAHYDRQGWSDMYQWVLLDAIISGEGTFFAGVRAGECFLEWGDALDVRWDTAFKEPHKRRFVFRDIHLPASEAVTRFPTLAKLIHYKPGQSGCEKTVTITQYWSRTTRATMYKGEFLEQPSPNEYGRLPGGVVQFFRRPGIKYSEGSVEMQLGTLQMVLRLQRYFRETTLRAGAPVGVAAGFPDESAIDQAQSGEEAVILRSPSNRASFKWETPGEVSQTSMKLYEMLMQALNAESGVNDFQKSQTDVNVDFASQLTFLAQQSGVQAKHTAQQFEAGVVDSIKLFMEIGATFAGPIDLYIEGTAFEFGPEMPINPLLGSDGEIVMKPGGMQYKSPAQKLQETMILAGALKEAITMPQGIAERFLKMVLDAAEVDDTDSWVDGFVQAQQQQLALQQQAAMAQQTPQPGQPQQSPTKPQAA